jgi:hypothetical protein
VYVRALELLCFVHAAKSRPWCPCLLFTVPPTWQPCVTMFSVQRRRVVATALQSLSSSGASSRGALHLELLPEGVSAAVQSAVDSSCGPWQPWLAEGLCAIAAACTHGSFSAQAGTSPGAGMGWGTGAGAGAGGGAGLPMAGTGHGMVDAVGKLQALADRFLRAHDDVGTV